MADWVDRVYPWLLPFILLVGVAGAVYFVWKNKRQNMR